MSDFSQEFFIANRLALAKKLPDSIIVVSANGVLQASADTEFKFRQDSNFWYLTGVDSPDLVLVIDTKLGLETIFFSTQNEYQKEWDGVLETESMTKTSGIKNFKPIEDLRNYLQIAKSNKTSICYAKPADEIIEPYGIYSNPAKRIIGAIVESVDADPTDIRIDIARLRQVKQECEIREIQMAINITGDSLKKVYSKIASYSKESEISKALAAHFYEFGADGLAFQSIVASGKNASIIHHRTSTKINSKSDLVLLDVGAQSGYYAADISRTWSINSKPSHRQNELYNGVIEIQNYAYSLIKPGVYLREYQKLVEDKAKIILQNLKCSTYDKPFPHAISHFLGLDVHDPGDYEQPLQENMILTVEPGIYLSDEGIGIRIEDDVLVTKNGIKILSSKIPSEL